MHFTLHITRFGWLTRKLAWTPKRLWCIWKGPNFQSPAKLRMGRVLKYWAKHPYEDTHVVTPPPPLHSYTQTPNKTNKMTCAQQYSDQPGSPPSLTRAFAVPWRSIGSLATHWAHNEETGQSERTPRLIRVSLGAHVILLVLLGCGSLVMWLLRNFNSFNTSNIHHRKMI